MAILKNRSYLRRFSGWEFARFVSICPGREQCGHDMSVRLRLRCAESAGSAPELAVQSPELDGLEQVI